MGEQTNISQLITQMIWKPYDLPKRQKAKMLVLTFIRFIGIWKISIRLRTFFRVLRHPFFFLIFSINLKLMCEFECRL